MTPFGPSSFEHITTKSSSANRIEIETATSWQHGVVGKGLGMLSQSYDDDGQLSPNRFIVFSLVMISALLFLYTIAFRFQVVRGKTFRVLSDENRLLVEVIQPERGVIHDRNGELLVRNDPAFNVYLAQSAREEADLVIQAISDVIDVSADLITENYNRSKLTQDRDILLLKGLDRDAVVRIDTAPELSGKIITKVTQKRNYLQGEQLAHVLGYVGEVSNDDLSQWSWLGFNLGDYVGKTGLEQHYEEFLHGLPGRKLSEKDASGISGRLVSTQAPVAGNNLNLTIDLKLQNTAYTALKEAIDNSKSKGGSAVVQDVNTGEILAFASYPAYDPNLFTSTLRFEEYGRLLKDERLPFFDRTLSGQYPPASTFKLVTATAALAEGVVTVDTQINEVQTIVVGGQSFSNWTLLWGTSAHGLVNVVKAIAYSSDIYFYEVSGGYESQKGLGANNLAKWGKLFGVGSKTGIDLPGEASGLMPDPQWKIDTWGEDWYLGDTYISAIGQGNVLTTPLQVANYTTAVANDGILFKPYLVSRISSRDGTLVKATQPYKIRTLEPQWIFSTIRQGMRDAVVYGTSVDLKNHLAKIAAKTGTAETSRKDKIHAWFTSFAPYDDPKITVTVFIEEGGQGSEVAAPIAKKIYDAYIGP